MKQLPPRDPVNLEHSTGIKNPFKVRIAIALAVSFITIFAVSANILMKPGVAKAAISTNHYSTSHYVSFASSSQTISYLASWAQSDANRQDPSGDNNSCSNNYYGKPIIAVLDFGNPNPSGGVYGVSNWANAWYNFANLSDFAYDYALDYFNDAGVCSHLTVAIGTNNSQECQWANYDTTCIYNEGSALANFVSIAESHIQRSNIPDFANQVNIQGADDIEMGDSNWDSYNLTANFLWGVATQGQYLWDYGIVLPCEVYQNDSNCGTGQTYHWAYDEIYDALWGIGYDMPLPEAYSASWPYDANTQGQFYRDVYNNSPGFYGQGVMNNVAWNDPSNYYGIFWSAAGLSPTANYFDTCMPSSPRTPSTWPCY